MFGVEKVGLEYFSGVEAEMLKLKTISKDNDVTNYKFTCTDKNGKSANGTYEYKLGGGSVDIESNEQDYSKLICLNIY